MKPFSFPKNPPYKWVYTKLIFDAPREGFAFYEVNTSSVVDAVRLLLMLPKGSYYKETEPLSGWQMNMLTS